MKVDGPFAIKSLAVATVVFPLRDTLPVPVPNVPAPVWLKFPEVVIPVAPVIAPPDVIAIVGVLIKLVNPDADAKLTPLITLELLLVAAGKLMPLSALVLLLFVALASVIFTPLT